MAKPAPTNYEVKAGLEHIEAFPVVGLSAVISGGAEKASEEINFLWQSFFEQQVAHKLPQRRDDVIYAVYSDYQGDHTKPYRLTIGYRMQNDAAQINSDALFCVQVEAGNYAMMGAQGEQPKALIETWQTIWQSDLNRTFRTDFEVYGSRFFEEGVHEVLVCIGVRIS